MFVTQLSRGWENLTVDDHAHRIWQGFLDAVEDFRAGQLSLLDLSRRAGQTASALDTASVPLPRLLESAGSDLEYAYFTTESERHVDEAGRILTPILAIASDNRATGAANEGTP